MSDTAIKRRPGRPKGTTKYTEEERIRRNLESVKKSQQKRKQEINEQINNLTELNEKYKKRIAELEMEIEKEKEKIKKQNDEFVKSDLNEISD